MPMSAFTGKQSKAFRFEAALTPCRPMHRDGVLGLAWPGTAGVYNAYVYF